MITSTSNAQIKNISELLKKSKARKEQKAFVIEGRRMFEEVVVRKDVLVKAYISESYMEENYSGCEEPSFDFEVVADNVFKGVAETVTPQGVLAVVKMPEYTVEDIMSAGKTVLILDNIQDPGNLGTMFRTAEAAGMAGIILSSDSVDAFNPKVIRSTMGGIFRVPFVYVENLPAFLKTLKEKYSMNLIAAHLDGKKDYTKADYSGYTGIMIGNEGNGLSDEVTNEATEKIIIPMAGKTESLNAAVAAALLMYEAARNR